MDHDRDNPETRKPSPPPPNGPEGASQAPETDPKDPERRPEDPLGPRVVGAGTSQELVIVNYDDPRFGARSRPKEPDPPAAETPETPSAPEASDAAEEPVDAEKEARLEESRRRLGDANQSLIIVRDMVDQYAREVEAQTRKADSAPPTPAEPAAEAPAPAVEPTPAADASPGPGPTEPEAAPSAEAPDPEPNVSVDFTPTQDLTPTDEPMAPPTVRPPAFAPPPPPPAPLEEEEPVAAEPEEPLVQVDWNEELAPLRRAAPGVVPPPVEPPRTSAPVVGKGRRRRPSEIRAPQVPAGSRVLVGVGGALLVAATALMALRIEPFATWYYLFAWYPFLMAVNHFTARRAPDHSVVGPRARAVLALAAASVPVWLLFEVWNFRLENWYYAGVPDDLLARRLGMILSFATVLPGLFFLEEAQRVRGGFRKLKVPEFPVGRGVEITLLAIGGAWLVATLVRPEWFFALVWGVPVLLLEPWLHRHDRESLLAELKAGRLGRILRLLVAGLGCGLFWETANYWAVGKWIYTVPGFAEGKLFEMPFLGFVGFAPFALCCWSLARALVVLGVLPDWVVDSRREAVERSQGRTIGGWVALAAFSALVMFGMDRWTVDSTTARPENVPAIPDGVAEYAHRHGAHDVRGLLALIDQGRLHIPGESTELEIGALRDRCELVELRGLGTGNAARLAAVNVHSVADLAAVEPAELTRRLAAAHPDWKPRPRRVDVWVRAARDAAN